MSIDEREWQAQEQALRDSRAGTANDQDALGYRRVADALRVAMPPQLPPDFAVMVAARAVNPSAIANVDTRLEARLTAVMTLLLVLAGLACTWTYGRDWMSPLLTLMPDSPSMPLRLAITIAACVALSWTLDGWRGRGLPRRR